MTEDAVYYGIDKFKIRIEDAQKKHDEWKAKKESALLKLYRIGDTDGIKELENEITQRENKLEQELAKLYKRMYTQGGSKKARQERAERTRKLCSLGGLIIKAQLDDLDTHTLLGMLQGRRQYLNEHPEVVEKWRTAGKKSFEAEMAAKAAKAQTKDTPAAPYQPYTIDEL